MKYLLFDLDGTLTASDEGIIKSVQYALEKINADVPEYEALKVFVGPPLRVGFPKFCGLNESQTAEAIKHYRERYATVGLFENQVYEGVGHMLKACCDYGYILLLATSKPRVFAVQILEHFDLLKYFTHVVGCGLDGTLDSKQEVVDYAISLCDCGDRSEFVMIGDRFYDVEGAKGAGLKSIGVLYGYGSRQELEEAGADYICETVGDLEKLLVNN